MNVMSLPGAPLLETLHVSGEAARYVPISATPGIARLPFALRVVLENLARQHAVRGVDTRSQIADLLARRIGSGLTFYPARIFGQDILGKVMLVDMAALRDKLAADGMDPRLVNPAVPVDIIIDHSLQVDVFGTPDAARRNLAREYERNSERFAFLRWCAQSFDSVRVVPPGKGIMHQIHIEKIGQVVWRGNHEGAPLLYPDTCVGTDSHTPMINGVGILGWGVGGIEAEAVMLGKPVSLALPRVIGIDVSGRLRDGVMPTDMVLAITERLRKVGVVGEFVEFFGAGIEHLSVPDRGTIANMAPEYGATAVYFPIDRRTLEYLRATGRDDAHVALIGAYAKTQSLWRDKATPQPDYDAVVAIDLADIRPSIAGPKNPEDRMDLSRASADFPNHVLALAGRPISGVSSPVADSDYSVADGSVAIAAITSCTNTSNPFGMIAAGLLARNAVARGLNSKPWVKTSLAPGSQVVADVLVKSGLQTHLDALGFHVVGFGCTTCNGGSGPLAEPIAAAIEAEGVVAAAVLSGNRNFQGRIHPNVRAAYLASPALVIAYALAGSMTVDVTTAPLGHDREGAPVFLSDIWPTSAEIEARVETVYSADGYRTAYAALFDGGAAWEALGRGGSALFPWDSASTYIRKPTYFDGLASKVGTQFDITGARPLAILGDNITTDDISPSGTISRGTPAADFLAAQGVAPRDFNAYTTRRGNHDVAVRATFANIRLKNHMVPGVEGGMTKLYPDGTVGRIFETAQTYLARKTPLLVIAGKNYGCGSSRDWAAKGVALLGVKAIIAEGFERIHRTNLVGMGVLPLQLREGTTAQTLHLDGSEMFDITGLDRTFDIGASATCTIRRKDGSTETLSLLIRLDTTEDMTYWRHGGILPFVWRNYRRDARRHSAAPAAETTS
jgi:aconitate hydratase